MNNNTVKLIGFYLMGGIIGGLTGKLIADKILEPKEIEEEDEWKVEDQPDNYLPKEEVNEAPVILKKRDKKKKIVTTPIDYSAVSRKNNTKPSLEEVAKEHLPEVDDPSLPHIISIEDYNDTGRNNDKVSYTYYDEDDTLADEKEKIVPDSDKILGNQALISFGLMSDDPDIVYVRNNKAGTDYEIVRVHKSYAETVAGIVSEETKKRSTRKAKKNNDDHDSEEE